MLKYGNGCFGIGEIWDELPMAQGYAYITGFISLDGWCSFSGIKPADGESYVEQETEQLVEIAKQAWESK